MLPVGKAANQVKLSDFTVLPPNGREHLKGTKSVHVYTFGDDGQVDGDYVYLDAWVIKEAELECEPGWYNTRSVDNDDPVYVGEVNIDFGRGISILSDCGAKVTCAGEVLKDPFPVSVIGEEDGGNTYTGNCSPVDLKLEDFTVLPPEGREHLKGTKSVHVYTFGDDGQVDGDYVYLDAWVIKEAELECDPGWYNTRSVDIDDPVSVGKVQIDAGRMISILSDCGAILTIPSAL